MSVTNVARLGLKSTSSTEKQRTHNAPGWAISRETIEKNKHKASAPLPFPSHLLLLLLHRYEATRVVDWVLKILRALTAEVVLKGDQGGGQLKEGVPSGRSRCWFGSCSGLTHSHSQGQRLLHFGADIGGAGRGDERRGGASRLELQIQHNVPLSFMHSLYKLGTMNFSTGWGRDLLLLLCSSSAPSFFLLLFVRLIS